MSGNHNQIIFYPHCFTVKLSRSNIDNLGATVDLNILNHIVKGGCQSEFIAEVTNKTPSDVKGG